MTKVEKLRDSICKRLKIEDDPDSMYTSRLRTVKRWLKEDKAKLPQPLYQSALQQKNIRIDIRRFQRQILYYEKKVKS